MTRRVRVALYGRVSTDLGEQDPEQQVIALRAEAERRGWDIVWADADMTTGDSELWEREKGKALWALVKAGKIDSVMTWDMSRLSREHPSAVFALLDLMERKYGVHYTSYTESFFDTANDDMRPLIVGIISWANNYFLKQLKRSTTRGKLASKARGIPQGRHPAGCGKVIKCPTGAHDDQGNSTRPARGWSGAGRRRIDPAAWQASPTTSPPSRGRTWTAASPPTQAGGE